MEHRISRKRHLPGYDVIWQIGARSFSLLSNTVPELGADRDDGTVSGDIILGFGTDLFCIGDVDEETGECGTAGLGVATNDVAVDTRDDIFGTWWEIAIVDNFLLLF